MIISGVVLNEYYVQPVWPGTHGDPIKRHMLFSLTHGLPHISTILINTIPVSYMSKCQKGPSWERWD